MTIKAIPHQVSHMQHNDAYVAFFGTRAETAGESRGLMTPGSPERLGIAIGEDGLLYHFRGPDYPTSAILTAACGADGGLSAPETPVLDDETLTIMLKPLSTGGG